MKRQELFRYGIPMLGMGFIMFMMILLIDGCNFTEKDYINSHYYNQTHVTFQESKKQCEDKESLLKLVPLFISMSGCVICIIAFFPDNPNQKDKGTMPRGWKSS